jgi:hypothetical protein
MSKELHDGLGFRHHNSHASGTTLVALGLFQMEMETSARCLEYAAECDRLAAEAKTEEHRKILREMARAWRKVAEEAEELDML